MHLQMRLFMCFGEKKSKDDCGLLFSSAWFFSSFTSFIQVANAMHLVGSAENEANHLFIDQIQTPQPIGRNNPTGTTFPADKS